MLKESVSILKVPEILLPCNKVDMKKWATIACDQFTSNQSYWDQVASEVGDHPSTLKITFPEFYLGKIDEARKIQDIHHEMGKYLEENLFVLHHGMILVEREIDHGTRYGLLTAIDLEDYDYTRTSTSWIRATEGTVAERIPPRIKIREGAPLEIPHILVLIDDDQKKLIEPLISIKDTLPVLYDFDLMMNSGHVRGYSLADPKIENQILSVVAEAQSDNSIERKYGSVNDHSRIIFAIGDGNHSLATAKAIWENHKQEWGMDHPARYAMVEIENLHDSALLFEPIHRVIFNKKNSVVKQLEHQYGNDIEIVTHVDHESLFKDIDATPEGIQSFGILENGKAYKATFLNPPSGLCVGSVQQFLDTWKAKGGFEEIDYIHGTDDVINIAQSENNASFYLPPVQKNGFFQSIIKDGALPRKTFSMGEAHEKRFYIECRRILK
jgi:hypothetical protein